MNQPAVIDTQTPEEMDAQDPLRGFRDKFHFPRTADGAQALYFLGNSLGLQPKTAAQEVGHVLEDWQNLAIDGYFKGNTPWLTYNETVRPAYADIVGAKPEEIVAMNTLTVNLHLMMISFYRPTKERFKLMVEKGAFPSDQYAVKSQIALHGFDPEEALIEVAPREGEKTLRHEDIIQNIQKHGKETALIMFGGVNYYTGQLFDMQAMTRAGHEQGCVVGFDLAHAAGNVPLHLHDWDVDFACWCSYKYLNGGPASIAAAFVHERHAKAFDLPRLTGWWGHDRETRFIMGPDFKPAVGADGWQLSNAPVLSLAPVRASLEIFAEAGIERIREKSLRLTGYLESLLKALQSDKFTIMTPEDPQQRGAQLSIVVHENGKKMHDILVSKGVVCDWREPDCIRLAPAPLYNSFRDVFDFVSIFTEALDS